MLNGVPTFDSDERAYFAGFNFAPLQPRADGSHLLAAWEQRLAATPGWTDLAAMHRHVATMLANPDRYFWGFKAAFAYDNLVDLARITAPTLVLTNSNEDLFVASLRAAKMLPDWAVTALSGGTHGIVDEQPQGWAAAVAGFVLGA